MLCCLRCGPQEELKLETTFLSQRNIALNTQIRSCGFYDPDAVAVGELQPRTTHATGGVKSHGTAAGAQAEAEAASEVCAHLCMHRASRGSTVSTFLTLQSCRLSTPSIKPFSAEPLLRIGKGFRSGPLFDVTFL
jgi:hypothetical protein